jgi:hypothetical protein
MLVLVAQLKCTVDSFESHCTSCCDTRYSHHNSTLPTLRRKNMAEKMNHCKVTKEYEK